MKTQVPIISHVLLCDSIRLETSQKEMLVGVYHGQIVVNNAPTALASFALRMEFWPGRLKGGTFDIEIVDPNGTAVVAGSGGWNVKEDHDHRWPGILFIQGGVLPLTSFGLYKVRCSLAKRPKKIVATFLVRQAAEGDSNYQPAEQSDASRGARARTKRAKKKK